METQHKLYDTFVFVAEGDFGIPKLHGAYTNELVRKCMDALNQHETRFEGYREHTNDFNPELPEMISIPEFDYLVMELNARSGTVKIDIPTLTGTNGESIVSLPVRAEINNVFSTHGIFQPERIVYDDSDGIRKCVVSLFFEFPEDSE